MLLIDDLLMAGGKGLLFIAREIAKRAEEEWLDEESLKRELQQLYLMLENGSIDEPEFEQREQLLIGRLEKVKEMRGE